MGVALEHQGRLCSRCGRPISPSVDGCSCLARQDAVASGAAPTSTRLGLLQSPWRRFAISLGVAAAAAGYGLLVGPPSGRLEVLLALVGFASLFWGRTLRFSLAALAVLVVLAPFVGARPGMLYPIVVAMAAAVAPGVKAWSRLLNTVVLAGIAIGAPSFATSAWAGTLRNVAFWAVVVFACIGLSHWLEAHVPHRTSVIHHRHR